MTVELRSCACRDCWDITIGETGELCTPCETAGCNPDAECQREDAYGYTDVHIDMEL